jgi:hypothetical protein
MEHSFGEIPGLAWPGMDGSDDPYEGFMNLALLYSWG